MSEEPLPPPSAAEATDDTSVAGRQAALGEEWARVYADPDLPIDKRAEMILRNPVVYLRDINPAQLPEDLQNRWHGLLAFCDGVATIADTETTTGWGSGVHGLEKVQSLVESGRINPDFRGSVGDVMRVASNLFAESVQHLPGNTAYYQGNIQGADNSLQKHRSGTQ